MPSTGSPAEPATAEPLVSDLIGVPTVSQASPGDRRSAWQSIAGPLAVTAVGVVSALLVVSGGARPVEYESLDPLVVGVPTALVTWLAAVVPRRWTAWVALVVGALSMSLVVMLGAAALHVAARLLRVPAALTAPSNALVAGAVLVMASRSELGGVAGASAAVAVGAGVAIVLLAAIRLGWRGRLLLGAAVVVPVAFFGFSTLHLALAADDSADELRAGRRFAEEGLRHLAEGDVAAARQQLSAASAAFAEAHDRLDTTWGRPAALVPVVAQHRRLGLDVTAIGRDGVLDIGAELDGFDFDDLGVVGGRFDLEALDSLAGRLDRIVAHVDELQLAVNEDRSEWLIDRIEQQLTDFELDLTRERERAELAQLAVEALPEMLGSEAARTYFLAFTTQSEARGLSGLMGNWAEVTVDDGRISVTGFGRSDDLDDAAPPGARRVTGPEEWIERYGEFGFVSGPGGGVGTDPWKNIVMSPQLSTTGQVIAELYPQSGGREIDGVFFLDVDTLSLLLGFTGPVELEVLGREVGPENVRQFLLRRQYDILEKTDRVDLLEDVSVQVVDRLLAGGLPPAIELIDVLGPQVEQRRLGAWLVRPEEQEVIERVGLSTDLPDPGPADALALTFNNFAGNKIDYYLRAELGYAVDIDSPSGRVQSTVRAELTNTAPAEGDPRYVIGNLINAPNGTNRTWVTVYSALPPVGVRLNGVDVGATFGTEAGYFTTSVIIENAAGGESTLEVDLEGSLEADEYELALTLPPTVAPIPVELDVTLDGSRQTESLEFVGTEVWSYGTD